MNLPTKQASKAPHQNTQTNKSPAGKIEQIKTESLNVC